MAYCDKHDVSYTFVEGCCPDCWNDYCIKGGEEIQKEKIAKRFSDFSSCQAGIDLPLEQGPVTAYGFLEQAASEMSDRSKTYDAPEGERSMGKTVDAFNALTGHNLTEQQGWQFMELLKIARSNQGAYRADCFVDGAAYAALAGEAASRSDQRT